MAFCRSEFVAVDVSDLDFCDDGLRVTIRRSKVEARRRDEMAKAAAPYVHPRMAPAQPGHPDPDFVPLHERIREYERAAAIQASEGGLPRSGPHARALEVSGRASAPSQGAVASEPA